MARLNQFQAGTFALIAMGMISGTAAPLLNPAPATAEVSSQSQTKTVVAAGTFILVHYDGNAQKILLDKNEKVPLTLTVSSPVKSRYGTTLIPAGTQIKGQLQPAGQGSQFVASEIILPFDGSRSINANSVVVTRTEQIKKGSRTNSILKGAALGGAAATAIAAITGDKAIATEEVLSGTGLGVLAGLFWGRKSVDVISVNPNNDLRSLTLRSEIPVTVALR
jgi:hypothetical protein